MLNSIIHGDCLEVMKDIPDKSINMILTDLPYGTTESKWDIIIPFEPLWEHYKRIIKDGGVIVLTAQQPFTSLLICSNLKMFKHNRVWIKDKSANFLQAKTQPHKVTEDVLIFSDGGFSYNAKLKATYNPIMEVVEKAGQPNKGQERSSNLKDLQPRPNPTKLKSDPNYNPNVRYPKNHMYFKLDKNKAHPTQKPVKLFEYLILTYSNEGDSILDSCIGSGTTAIACMNTNRNYIGIEMDQGYVDIANKRILETKTNIGGIIK